MFTLQKGKMLFIAFLNSRLQAGRLSENSVSTFKLRRKRAKANGSQYSAFTVGSMLCVFMIILH